MEEVTTMKKIIDLEKRGWDALSKEGNAAVDFYHPLLLDDAVFLFPGGLRIEGKEEILRSFAGQPWKYNKIEDPKVSKFAENISVLTYRVSAKREGDDAYQAWISSVYIVIDGDWKLGYHQHTLA
jgi:ketosteroid isomerase-like protein